MLLILCILTLLFSSCEKPNFKPPQHQEIIAGRNFSPVDTVRLPLYQANVPDHWIRKDPDPKDSLADTMKPLCEYTIHEGNESVRITIHNFPVESIHQRVSPNAQINRWCGQFDNWDPTATNIVAYSHDGFIGLFLECQGTMHNQSVKMLGCSMQLAPELFQNLPTKKEAKQMGSDYTIKALGPPWLVDKHFDEIYDFANSFRLIEELVYQ